eukprot:CAMPEP_0198515370 /NCGR_PEP_ID=MMETSP1462-20131121/17280_1 /TAXON_ID=1333877 /ORGANISM="Brandtodinium nutriculum, Strain RCC3387" /LENGTH=153 /DNA_ID=CAMNT_0044244867 /DNA_START=64 /DNA_END=522 /DNA_ORIENTATION=-
MAGQEDWVSETMAKLSTLVTMPKNSEKFLRRPPVWFVHTVITEVMKATDFADGLYSDEECRSSYLVDRETKRRFVHKAVKCVSFALDEELDVSVSKVLAGLEGNKTSAFFLKLHHAAVTCSRARSADAVDRVRAWEATGDVEATDAATCSTAP